MRQISKAETYVTRQINTGYYYMIVQISKAETYVTRQINTGYNYETNQ